MCSYRGLHALIEQMDYLLRHISFERKFEVAFLRIENTALDAL